MGKTRKPSAPEPAPPTITRDELMAGLGPANPADFTEADPPPRGRPRGEPLPRVVVLRTHEPVPEHFAEWERQGRTPAGAVLAVFVGGTFEGGSGYATPDGKAIPAKVLERHRIASEVRHEGRPGKLWVILVGADRG